MEPHAVREESAHLLFHGIVAAIVIVTVAILALRNINGVERDVVIGADVRVADDVQLERVRALRQRELELDVEAPSDGHALDGVQLSCAGFADHDPPVGKLLPREVRRDDGGIASLVVVICILAECNLQHNRAARCVLSLDELVCDIKCRVGVDERGYVAPR